jgi:hypothetical protein
LPQILWPKSVALQITFVSNWCSIFHCWEWFVRCTDSSSRSVENECISKIYSSFISFNDCFIIWVTQSFRTRRQCRGVLSFCLLHRILGGPEGLSCRGRHLVLITRYINVH